MTKPSTGKGTVALLGGAWRGLNRLEAPESWLFDVLYIPRGSDRCSLDPLFVEACEELSIVILSVHPPSGGAVARGSIVLPHCDGARVLVGGIRRGARERFPLRTPEEAD